ncbi:hydantoinase B/oxoprolinase family protein [Nakamurella lactea]|uniref:hydantoinase B/oxoprolinase family protein n=1 Tax=Nakamurella lactea TaxID=459515 RepID=UPI0004255B83|nr:hydantoinase B/oxoprolinase family protein [Nakamurella lactea]
MITDLPDPITLEIIRHRLDGINDEAAIMLRRVSGSQIAVEANDLNTAITTADGTVVACGKYVLCQVASLNLVTRDVLDNYRENPGIAAGDQFLTNDPYVGTLHQPDVVLIAPVFHQGTLIGWCGSTVHQSDVGGGTAGGLSLDSQSIFDEPLPMPPIRIVEGDRIRRDIERDYLARSRTPQLNALDLAGQIAANRAAVQAVQALCVRYGAAAVVAAMDHLVDVAEVQLRERLRALPDGSWRQVSYLQRGRPTADDADVYAVRLTVSKTGDELELDFSASSPQAPGGINAALPALVNFSIASVLIYLCADLLWVPGAVPRVVRIVSREGTVAHARWPAGVAMSTATSCQAIRSVVNGCLSRMLESSAEHADRTMAGCQSSGAGGGVFAGTSRTGEPFSSMTLDELTGGGGATAVVDGADSSGSTTSPGAACANVEVNESYLPVLYLERRELADSAGPGRRRGGSGCSIVLRPHGTADPIQVVSFAQGLQHPSAIGLAGGDPGRQSVFAVLPAGSEQAWQSGPVRELPLPDAKVRLAAGEVHLAVTQGGGGYGDPLDRNPDDVVADVVAGHVSRAGAARDYGVLLLDGPHPALDEAATTTTRAQLRQDRIGGRAPAPALSQRPGRRWTTTLDLTSGVAGDRIVCARCGGDLGAADGDPYSRMALQEVPTSGVAPWPVRFPGSERFVVRRLHCPHCGVRMDVQVALRTDPVVRAAEPR